MDKDQLRDTYLRSGGKQCPFCGTELMTDDVTESPRYMRGYKDADRVLASVRCPTCHARWEEIFTLNNIDILYTPSPMEMLAAGVDGGGGSAQMIIDKE